MNKNTPASTYSRMETPMGTAARRRLHTAIRTRHAHGESDAAIQKAMNIPATTVADALDMRIRR